MSSDELSRWMARDRFKARQKQAQQAPSPAVPVMGGLG